MFRGWHGRRYSWRRRSGLGYRRLRLSDWSFSLTFFSVGSGETQSVLYYTREWCVQSCAQGAWTYLGLQGESWGWRGPSTSEPLGPMRPVLLDRLLMSSAQAPAWEWKPLCRLSANLLPLLLQENRGRVWDDHCPDDRWVSSLAGAQARPEVSEL